MLVADQQSAPGGVIRSVRQDGFLLELGPSSFSASRSAANALIEELGLGSRMQSRIMMDHVRYVWRNRHLCRVPSSLGQFLRTDLLTVGEKLQLARGIFRRLPQIEDDVEAGSYFRARIGDGAVEAMLKVAAGRAVGELKWKPGRVRFTASGSVQVV